MLRLAPAAGVQQPFAELTAGVQVFVQTYRQNFMVVQDELATDLALLPGTFEVTVQTLLVIISVRTLSPKP